MPKNVAEGVGGKRAVRAARVRLASDGPRSNCFSIHFW